MKWFKKRNEDKERLKLIVEYIIELKLAGKQHNDIIDALVSKQIETKLIKKALKEVEKEEMDDRIIKNIKKQFSTRTNERRLKNMAKGEYEDEDEDFEEDDEEFEDDDDEEEVKKPKKAKKEKKTTPKQKEKKEGEVTIENILSNHEQRLQQLEASIFRLRNI